jgi:hypothetical protein
LIDTIVAGVIVSSAIAPATRFNTTVLINATVLKNRSRLRYAAVLWRRQ